MDDDACQTIVNRFNADAEAGTLSHGQEMLIDHEHFRHDADKETIAYGWLTRLQNRDDGIYGQIRWSATGINPNKQPRNAILLPQTAFDHSFNCGD